MWLAPKLPDGVIFPKSILSLSETFLIDAYCKEVWRTGELSIGRAFSVGSRNLIQKKWVLAGGLSSNNITSALNSTGAKYVDVNSGVEKEAGIKDHEKMVEFFSKKFLPHCDSSLAYNV